MPEQECTAGLSTTHDNLYICGAQAAPVLDHQPLDLWALFRAVAQRGGYQAATATRYAVCACTMPLSAGTSCAVCGEVCKVLCRSVRRP